VRFDLSIENPVSSTILDAMSGLITVSRSKITDESGLTVKASNLELFLLPESLKSLLAAQIGNTQEQESRLIVNSYDFSKVQKTLVKSVYVDVDKHIERVYEVKRSQGFQISGEVWADFVQMVSVN